MTRLTSFHFTLEYKGKVDVTRIPKNLGYFIKQIESSVLVSVWSDRIYIHEAISNEKIAENTTYFSR